MSRTITIGRQFGSGGREIGEKLAKKLNVQYYDKKLLEMAAKKSGLCEEIIGKYDETGMNSLLYSLAMNPLGGLQGNTGVKPIGVKAQMAVKKQIQELAEAEPAVFVGRCADSILCGKEDVVNVFISAKMEDRIHRVMQRHNVLRDEAVSLIAKTDKARASYYNYYTEQKWGDAKNYHICLDSSWFGIEGTVEILYQILSSSKGGCCKDEG
ncbi:MAG: cytidylate kinase-like family protein [Lachnospiraceae bacterium]|nr:cytidylate kinase-like family protein [Lachnospiraceae bacterium]